MTQQPIFQNQQPKKTCPLATVLPSNLKDPLSGVHPVECMETMCSWWNSLDDCCTVVKIEKRLDDITETIWNLFKKDQ